MTTETSAETVREILARGRAADELGRLCRRLGLSAPDIEAIADAVRHCPRALANAGRALAIGGRARNVVGPDPAQGWDEHLAHALDHLDAAGFNGRATTDTGLEHLAHAAARVLLAWEVAQ